MTASPPTPPPAAGPSRRREWALVGLLAVGLVAAVAGLRVALHRRQQALAGGPSATAQPVEAMTDQAADALVSYVVAPGDSLSGIAARHGLSTDALMALNGLTDPDSIQAGDRLFLQLEPEGDGPDLALVPDSELVRGPAYLGWDTGAFLARIGSPLMVYVEEVDGEMISGPDLVERASREFSVGPRVLLAFLEARSGQVTGLAPREPLEGFPAGMAEPARQGLWRQLNWLADRLNGGYYDLKTRRNRILLLRDGRRLRAPESVNAGSFAVQRAVGLQADEPDLEAELSTFQEAYRALFGDPWQGARPELDLARLRFPQLGLPWGGGETWWLTGGPHGAWADGSAWSALDFVPDGDERGCFLSQAWVRAVADGVVVAGQEGQLFLDLDLDGRVETGPVVMYLHLAAEDRAAPGSRVAPGEALGHPSCEGGVSNATHLHIARLYDGEWLAAGTAPAFRLGEWTAYGAPAAYDGGLRSADGEGREACECRLAELNAVR